MANQTVSSTAPTLTFDDTAPVTHRDFRIKAEASILEFEAHDGSSYIPAIRIQNSQTRFQRRLEILDDSGDSALELAGTERWRLHGQSSKLSLEMYYSSAWDEILGINRVSGAEDTIRLHASAVMTRSGALVVDQVNTSEDTIALFRQDSGGTVTDTSVHKAGWLVTDSAIGVRTAHKTSAPSGGSVGDVVVYTDTSTYTSYLMVKTSHTGTAWRGLELDQT
jgi:hypothetical protein